MTGVSSSVRRGGQILSSFDTRTPSPSMTGWPVLRSQHRCACPARPVPRLRAVLHPGGLRAPFLLCHCRGGFWQWPWRSTLVGLAVGDDCRTRALECEPAWSRCGSAATRHPLPHAKATLARVAAEDACFATTLAEEAAPLEVIRASCQRFLWKTSSCGRNWKCGHAHRRRSGPLVADSVEKVRFREHPFFRGAT